MTGVPRAIYNDGGLCSDNHVQIKVFCIEKNRSVHAVFKKPGLLFAAFAILLPVLGFFAFWQSSLPELEVTFIDVGQGNVVGDAILLRSSEGKVALIDGGEKGNGALPYLTGKNITHIDLVVLTHAHQDHIGGLIDIIRSIPVDTVVTNGQQAHDPFFHEFEQAVRASGAEVVVVKAGDTIPFGRLTFRVLSPRKISTSMNNNSIVLRLVNGRVSFLFTGDMEEMEESRLLSVSAPVRANILKVAHHGASTSSSMAFLRKVRPAVAVYSAGPANNAGLPEQKALENLHDVGAEIYGTDMNGTITVLTDGWKYTVSPERVWPRGR